jgi:phospholipid/cholesterol/gamma-HCH transport system permease protein
MFASRHSRHSVPATARLHVIAPSGAGPTRLALDGQLDISSVEQVWPAALTALRQHADTPVVVDASAIRYCDGAGIAMLVDLLRQQRAGNAQVRIENLQPHYQALLDQFAPGSFREHPARPRPRERLLERLGRAAAQVWRDVYAAVAFIGEAMAAFAAALRRPAHVRWGDTLLVAQRLGVEGLPIISLVGFLMGVILAFQSAVALRKFGAEILVADLLGISLMRELGALMTAILLAGRSGAAFAAEIGTMKVNEELDALTTMGLDPTRFLVVPRVLAALAMTPLLTLYAILIGLVGGALVMLSFDIPFGLFRKELFSFVTLTDFLGGMAKTFVFGLIVACVGCLRGLQTRSGAAAVGLSTTSAVVTAIVLVVVADGIFAVVYYHLDI